MFLLNITAHLDYLDTQDKVLVTLWCLKIIRRVSNWYCYIRMHVIYLKGYSELGMEFQKQMVPVCRRILHDNNDAI